MILKVKNNLVKRKDGFTLIEVVAVLAIVSILTAVFVPKISTYVEKAKKTKALEEVRQVVLAVEDYNISSQKTIKDNASFLAIKKIIGNDAENLTSITTIKDNMTYKAMEDLVNGSKSFKLNNGKIEVVEVTS